MLDRAPPLTQRGVRLALAVAAVTALSGHVAPSVDDNNRYLKLTPLADRVRLAYTVFYGELPGRTERAAIDTDHDGAISEAEGHAFGLDVAAKVASSLVLDVDGKPTPVRWDTIDVGMGTPSAQAGSFSIDLVAYVCFDRAGGDHRVLVHDRFRLPHPGETEVRVEDSPGVRVERAHVGAAEDPSFDYRFIGPGGPLEDDGLELAYSAGDKAPRTADGRCRGPGGASAGAGRMAVVVAGVAIAVAAIAGALLLRRRRAAARAARVG